MIKKSYYNVVKTKTDSLDSFKKMNKGLEWFKSSDKH